MLQPEPNADAVWSLVCSLVTIGVYYLSVEGDLRVLALRLIFSYFRMIQVWLTSSPSSCFLNLISQILHLKRCGGNLSCSSMAWAMRFSEVANVFKQSVHLRKRKRENQKNMYSLKSLRSDNYACIFPLVAIFWVISGMKIGRTDKGLL